MINIKYDLAKNAHSGSGQELATCDFDLDLKRDLHNIPERSLVAFHTQLGTLEGYFQRLGRISFKGNIEIHIRHGRSSTEGSMTVYQEQDGILVKEIMGQIDGLVYALAHGYLGEYKITFTFSQTCEFEAVA